MWELFQDDDVSLEVIVGPPLARNETGDVTFDVDKPVLLRVPSGQLAVDSVESLEGGPGAAVVPVPPGDWAATLQRVLPESFGDIPSGGAQAYLCLQPADEVPGVAPAKKHLAFPHPGMTTRKIQQLLRRLDHKEMEKRAGAINDLMDAHRHPMALAIADRLVTLADDAEPMIRWNVAYTVGHLRANAHVEVLIRLSRDEDSRVRDSAYDGLGRLPNCPPAAARLFEALDEESDRQIRSKILESCVRSATSTPAARPQLEALIAGPDRRAGALLQKRKDMYIRLTYWVPD
ncbi:MAG: HEAT repeat domain-containing protein [Proteobacteria bacterium]|nr:HEAT repeat domain-containing protein [Pseudomonadota bacterium]